MQEDFIVSGGSTLQKLDDYIRARDGAAHLIGKATGAAPEVITVRGLLARYPDFARRLPSLATALTQPDPAFSYTQWEARLDIPPTRLRHTAERLVGRDAELTLLDKAWNNPHINLIGVSDEGTVDCRQ